jgi:hypothetical protein
MCRAITHVRRDANLGAIASIPVLPENEPHSTPLQRHPLEPLETDGGRRIPRALCLHRHSSCGQSGLVHRAVGSPKGWGSVDRVEPFEFSVRWGSFGRWRSVHTLFALAGLLGKVTSHRLISLLLYLISGVKSRLVGWIQWVDATPNRNPLTRASIAKSRSRALIEAEHHPGYGLIGYRRQNGSPWGSAVGSTD